MPSWQEIPVPLIDHRHCPICGRVLIYNPNPAGTEWKLVCEVHG